jgi:hypothetical protein
MSFCMCMCACMCEHACVCMSACLHMRACIYAHMCENEHIWATTTALWLYMGVPYSSIYYERGTAASQKSKKAMFVRKIQEHYFFWLRKIRNTTKPLFMRKIWVFPHFAGLLYGRNRMRTRLFEISTVKKLAALPLSEYIYYCRLRPCCTDLPD